MPQIPLNVYNTTNITNNVDVSTLFDNNLNTTFFPGFGAEYYPCRILFDFGTVWNLTNFQFYDTFNASTLSLYTSLNDPFNTIFYTSITENLFNAWNTVPLNNISARYVILEFFDTAAATTPEIKFSGTTTGSPIVYSSSTLVSQKISNYINTNSYHWMDNSINNNFGFVREFQEWEWMENIQGVNTFDPSWSGAGNYDTHYASLKSCGTKVIPVIQSSPTWFSGSSSWDNQWKPMSSTTLNAELPFSYYAASRFAWQYGARFGRVTYPASSLTINTTPFYNGAKPNQKISGSNLLEYVEFWNESEKTWKGRNGRFTAFEQAAYISAVVDGHCGTMGPNLGLKAADPSMKFVMAGMYDFHFEFLKSMVLWFKYYRPDGKVPIDIVNVHHYSNSLGGQFAVGAVGISPESDNLVTSVTQFVTQCKTILPGIPVWISEFGYDSCNGSLQKVPSITGQTQVLTQANLIIRTILAYTKAKLDKSFVFNIYDEDVNQNTASTYQSSGLVMQQSLGYKPKPGYNYLLAFSDLMSNFYYLKDNSISGTYVYKYINDQGDYVYACWSPTTINTQYTFNLVIEETNIVACQYRLIETLNTFESQKLQIINGSVNINVNEGPKFILVQDQNRLNNLYPIKIKNKKFF